ncbi:hypothetical protein QNI19_05230 [Cytophagaceae bacterium DM2B3-1]|uniref:Uncharacterized protein n=1 Tax=Xanthocytophaga flava TaxID=3048013 RepID=A0ABT7CI26_9BACT|nr:hypothetical protein [Xanthocytophaga flavus]MDJ1492324.1 hypothetical protein [Xanthocytophaga flavus]
MKDTNIGALVTKRVAFSALIMAGIIGLFMGLSYWQKGSTSLDWRLWLFIGFWGVALAVDIYRFASRNTLSHTSVRYGDSDTGQDRLDAILQASGYAMDHKENNRYIYIPTMIAGSMNRPIVVEVKERNAVIDGPSFLIDHIEQRVENLNYVDMSIGEAASKPLGTSVADYNTQSGLGSTDAEVFNPKTA